MFLVGLTGGIGTGKSTVAKMLEERGIPVVDADVFARKGSPELTSAFISLRSSHDELFTKRRNSASHGYSIILQKLVESQLVEENTLTPRQLRKKWENLLKRYRKLKHAASAGIVQYASGSELTFENWPFYKDMDQILVKQDPVSHHMLLPDSASNNTYDYPEEYAVSAKRLRANAEDCATVEVVEPQSPTHGPVQVKTSASPVHVQSRSDVIHRLLNQHERFIALYERLVIALEKFTE